MFHTIKQFEERNVANEIETLLWSDRMDLVAISNVKGEVALHRLTWARAWSLGPTKEGNTIKGMAWRPDGKVLAVAYSSGEILLVNIENKSTLHTMHLEGNISCIFWVRENKVNQTSDKQLGNSEQEEQNDDYMKYLDYSSKFLADPPPLSSLGSSVVNAQEESLNLNLFHDQTELNLLIIGTNDGFLHISIFGQFPCAVLNLSSHLGYKCSVINVQFSEHLCYMYVTVKDENNYVKIVIMNTEIFKTHAKELFLLALKHGHLNSLITYLSNAISSIKETWETILLEMDAKLSKYASKVPQGTLTADFLDLLMFGITSDEMQEFLLHDLTEKGLKKFGQVTEMCYGNIQKLLLKHVTKAGQNITFHLAELRGMARLEHRYKVVGVSEDLITEAINSSGAFLKKGEEMHQIINHFMLNYKAFFCWLYTAILHLLDEQVPTEMPKTTQQDIAHIAEFVQNFSRIGVKADTSTKYTMSNQFTMERMGQYLEDAPLTIPPVVDNNFWETFIKNRPCLQNNPCIIKPYYNFSLIQQFKHLKTSMENIFTTPKSLIAEQFTMKGVVHCTRLTSASLRITGNNFNPECTLFAFLNKKLPADGLYLLEIINQNNIITAKCGYFFFQRLYDNCEPSGDKYQILDAKFYSTNILSLLLQDVNKVGVLYQFPASAAREKLVDIDLNLEVCNQNLPKINGFDLVFTVIKNIEGMSCSQFSVSGCRRVSIVVSENRRKVQLFEMEAEEEDEEDADMTNSARESDTSMQEEVNV